MAMCGAFALIGLWHGMPGVPPPLWWALIAVLGVSLADDRKALPASLRLVVHLSAAAIWCWHLLGAGWSLCLAVLLVAWSANLFNFMDGSDGLAAGMAISGFTLLGVLAAQSGHALALPALVAGGCAAGFLLFNFPPARLFMGDAGSIPLGFLAAGLGLWGMRDGLWTAWVPALAFAPFVIDASATLLLRVMKGKKPWEAHREHLYQRVVLRGASHRRLLVWAYPMMLACAALAWLVHHSGRDSAQLWGPIACLSLATLYVLARIRVARSARDAG